MKNNKLMKNIVNSFKINTLSSRKGLGVGLLFLLLTLGVGQMWATDYYYRGDKNSWGATKMTAHNSGLYAYYSTSAQSFNGDKFKIALTTSSWNYNYSYVAKSFNGGSANIGDYSSDNCYIWDSNNGYVLIYYPNTAVNTTSNPKISFRTSLYTPTFYIKHTWNGSTWTWATMTRTGTGIYTYTGNCYTANGANVYMSQSDNNYLTPSGTSGVNNGVPAVWTYNSTANSLSVEPAYTLTVNSGGNGTATGSVSKGIKMSTAYSISATPNGGYRFKNWTVTSGTASFGSSTSASTTVTVTGSASAVIQANFEEIPGGTITLTAGTGGKVSNDNSSWGSSATISGITTATDKNIYAQANSGYSFNTWTKTSGSGTIKTNAASGVFTTVAGADAALTASFTENMRSVTISVSPAGAGTLNKTSASVGVATTTTVTATARPGYRFTGWTATNCSVASTSSASTTLSGNGSSGSGTLVANFARTYAFVEGRFRVMNEARSTTTYTYASGGQWNESSTSIAMDYDETNHRFYRHTYMTPKELTANHGTGCDDCKPYFYFKRSRASGSLSSVTSYMCTSAQTLTASGTANKKTLSSSSGSNSNLRFNSTDETGYAILFFDESSVWYELEHTLKYNANGGTGSAPAATTYYNHGVNATAASNTYTRSGYTFNGWNTVANGSGSSYAAGASVPMNSNITLYAQWTPVTYTISFSQSGTGYASGGQTADMTATYGAAMPTPISIPTAANGYAFMGYYDAIEPLGTQYYTSTGTSARNWDKTSATTLYAYFKKAEITGITFSPAAAEPGQTVTATATISPTPVAPTTVCWEVRYAANDNPLSPQPTFTPEAGASVSFEAPGAGVYKFVATLRTGSSCAAGDVLSTANENFTVTGSHSVTIRYKHGDAVIKEEIIQNIHAIDPTQITAPSIVGYSFSSWTLGDGITKTSGTLTSPSIYVTAIYDGVITANYNPKRMIYFYNTLGWSNVYAYFYSNDKYWGYGSDEGKGTGSSTTWEKDGVKPFIKSGAMTRIAGTNIWYYDCEANSIASSVTNVAFTSLHQTGYTYFAKTSTTKNNVVRRGDYNSAMPMFVPVDQDGVSMNGGLAIYYNEGYWMNYPENTGYTVRIYNAWNADKTSPAREYYFPYSSDKKMPLKLDVEFNTTDAKWFMIYRNDGAYLSVNAVMTQASHTNYRIKDSNDKIKIQPSAPGIYTYTLTYYDDEEKDGSGKAYGNMYHITVDYPVSVGDYRILYKDNATWSQGWAHNSAGHAWCHPSDAINKITGGATEAKKDTVSLFVSYGASPTAKFQYVSAINPSTGVVTWKDVAGGTINLSSITKSGTYNFIISQPVGGASVSVEKIEAYTGNYYIRTDCAGNTKWDNYRAADHQMTYSEFSCSEANSFGEKFSHYFAHWCPAGMNVKFVIANDYSSCISDTLIQDVGNTYANINGDGSLNSDGNAEETENRYSANIRFMYNEATNKISRAYVASSTNDARWFLVLRSNSEIHGEDNIAVEDIGTGKPSVILDDKQNWIYEQTLKILPGTRFKLFACYADVTPTEARAQYFRGNYATNSWSNENTIELVGGNPASGYQLVRVLYDFKTNRLVCAWLPDGTVSGDNAINADVMVIREHQEDARMITFDNSSSKLSGVKTVYGAMKFNRWTLNNKSSESGHAVLDPSHQKSVYERALYFISFPFDVNLGEVFGFGTYGVHWIIEYYDGLTRAKNGYWIDSPPNWKYVMSPKGYTLEANRGYILCLDLDLMKDDNEEFWPHGIETVELFFPSSSSLETIKQTNCTIPALSSEYQCTINRGTGTEGDRRVKDSYWRCLGVPSFANYTTELSNGTSTITWQPTGNTLPFLYAWNMTDNTLTPQNTSTWAFKTMHAYLAQCPTKIIWSATSGPSSIVARRENEMPITEYEWRLELAQDSQMVDQAYIRMSNLEQVTDTFDFGQDLSKEFNATRSNIYSFIGYEKAAANSMPLKTEQTTIVAIGLNIITAGEYTLGMPDGTDGVGVTLVDSETGTRTNLGAGMTYTLTLAAGDYTSRFYLEISPVKETPTGLEQLPTTNDQSPIKKLLIDGILYIIRDGKIFDARGVMVK